MMILENLPRMGTHRESKCGIGRLQGRGGEFRSSPYLLASRMAATCAHYTIVPHLRNL